MKFELRMLVKSRLTSLLLLLPRRPHRSFDFSSALKSMELNPFARIWYILLTYVVFPLHLQLSDSPLSSETECSKLFPFFFLVCVSYFLFPPTNSLWEWDEIYNFEVSQMYVRKTYVVVKWPHGSLMAYSSFLWRFATVKFCLKLCISLVVVLFSPSTYFAYQKQWHHCMGECARESFRI